MASIFSTVNRLLPFATPGTPLLQDLVHLGSICLLLFFAPQIQEWLRPRLQRTTEALGTVIDSQTVDLGDEQPQANGHLERDAELLPAHAEANGVIEDGHHAVANGEVNGEVDEDEDDDEDDEVEGQQHDAINLANGSANRDVGAKKAKSLARKDQRRAYNEFMRSQGDAQRARDAEGAAEREAQLEVEKKRRALAEAELDAKKAAAREQKKEAERLEREADIKRRETAVALVKADLASCNLSDLHTVAKQLTGDVGEEWVEKVINASGMIGRSGDTLTMITSTGWVARISETHAREAYRQAIEKNISDEHGYINDGKFSELFASTLADRSVSVN